MPVKEANKKQTVKKRVTKNSAPKKQEVQKIKLEFDIEQVKIIHDVFTRVELPFVVSAPIISAIEKQLKEQI